MLNIGTCGLHTVHNAFKHGAKASGWSIDKVLSSVYKIFGQSPSRRGDYEKLTRGIYPLQFYSHKWVEYKLVGGESYRSVGWYCHRCEVPDELSKVQTAYLKRRKDCERKKMRN